ncbi:potassium transporter TrkG [Aurantimonas sp. C2-6-R+9]|uniref:potassium transporter TrkG n=1 Tax=unclassified Aurantimonas TaxID=2638230 RepID=UPI002E179D5C|nr:MULTISPECIES: potassium transporter TrkG [unclassified Aurantimonas]MEC5293740.1 potassium transporter TrkG [Aurantimonas sp. C2-3-R2]MEC5383818.1 potassium transporter TrkG [Aurantimonas sp. C2-6-R+9]MEC5414804.1 potassium transporter TrkG [Aurantimonas sp. C2-4-R8]
MYYKTATKSILLDTGFNTIDITALHDSTSLMMIALMIIGGGSTSTAGGIKVTTFIVLCLATITFLKRRETISIFGRSLGPEEVMKALALAMIGIAVLILALFIMSITNDVDFLDLLFEVASALGTVGLSRGATGQLDTVGQIVIIAVMFIGRAGPLSLGFFRAYPLYTHTHNI